MTSEELRSQIEACIEDCLHSPSSGTEHTIMLTKAILLLVDTVAHAAELLEVAIGEVGPPGQNKKPKKR